MAKRSHVLLELEKKCSSTEKSLLVVCKNDDESILKTKKMSVADDQKKPVIAPLPPSQFLTRMKDFLGEMAEANEMLKLDAKDKSSKDYDIEVLSGNESQLIEMDLILGIADLNTPEAIAAAESAIAGNQPVIPIATSDSESESISDEEDDDEDEDEDEDNESEDEESNKTFSRAPTEKSMSREGKSSTKAGCDRSAKGPKIIEIS